MQKYFERLYQSIRHFWTLTVDTCIDAEFFQVFAVAAKLVKFVNFPVFLGL